MALKSYLLTLYIQTALSAVVAFIAFYKLSERNKSIKLIGLLFTISFLCNLSGYLFVNLKLSTLVNLPGSFYDFALVLIVALLFNEQTKQRFIKTFTFLTVLFFAAALINLFFIQKGSISSFNKLLSSFLILGYAIFYFYRLMVELPTSQVHRFPMFWFNSAFLFYHAGTIFLFTFTSYLINVLKDNMFTYWIFHNILGIIQQLIILIGLTYDLRIVRMETKS
jgi:hypothetical protein